MVTVAHWKDLARFGIHLRGCPKGYRLKVDFTAAGKQILEHSLDAKVELAPPVSSEAGVVGSALLAPCMMEPLAITALHAECRQVFSHRGTAYGILPEDSSERVAAWKYLMDGIKEIPKAA